MTNIIMGLATALDAKTAIEKAMTTLCAQFREVTRTLQGSIVIFVAPCTPRNLEDFYTHSRFATVTDYIVIIY
jgi:hypothetical protein